MKFISKLIKSVGLVAILFMLSCNQAEIKEGGNTLMKSMDNDVYHEWNNVFMQVERYATFYRPGPAPRALAYMGYSAYEACLGGMPEYQTLQYRFGITDLPPTQTNLYWPEVINASYAYLMNKFFANVTFKDKAGNVLAKSQFLNIISLKEKELKEKYRRQTVEPILNSSEAHGQEVAASIWRYSVTDLVGHDANLNPFPNPVNAQGCEWVPTDQVASKGLFSQWGQVRRFALSDDDMNQLVSPFECDADTNSVIYAQAYEMYVLARIAKKDPSGEMEHIAEFWSDDRVGWAFSPASRFVAIADQIVELQNFDLQTTCVLYAQLGMAENEAAVIAWYNKYKFNVERPITYIHRNIDANFEIPWLGFTPPFPSYPSGHATFGFAGVGILEAYVGGNYEFTDHCHEGSTDFYGGPRRFNTLRDLANENGFSRLPLGVHYRMDYDGGNFCGTRAAKRVLELPWKK